MDNAKKTVIIIEGADSTGKTQLCKYLQDLVEGKCHIIHSNYSKQLPENNHRRQHFLIAKFVSKQFDCRHYTGNRLVILDRNYISDIIYGQIGYGSKGTLKQKIKTLSKLFKILSKNANVIVIHCNPVESKFDTCFEKRQELLSKKENETIRKLYSKFFLSREFLYTLRKNKISYYEYSFLEDLKYKQLHEFLERNGV